MNQWLFKEWQIASGNFKNRSYKFGKSFYIDRDGIESTRPKIIKYIFKQQGKTIAINDGPMTESEFETTKKLLKDAFEIHLSQKSTFEK